jgi:hypothetical protein
LEKEVHEMKELCGTRDWTTDDPLGLGGLLCDGLWLARLLSGNRPISQGVLEELLAAAADGLEQYLSQNPFQQSVEYRLAFRELGLSIGLQAVARMRQYLESKPAVFQSPDTLERLLARLSIHHGLADTVEGFWLTAENRRAASWTSHREINMVLLATSLVPDGFLGC